MVCDGEPRDGGSGVHWETSRFEVWGGNKEFCFGPTGFEMPFRRPSGAANQVIHLGAQENVTAGAAAFSGHLSWRGNGIW